MTAKECCQSWCTSILVLVFFFIFNLLPAVFPQKACAELKYWSQVGDNVSFEDAANWLPSGIPNLDDDVEIIQVGANILASETFHLKSLAIGGKGDTSLRVDDFVIGEISPEQNTDIALYIKKGGNVILQGSGQVKLSGSFKNSEESLVTSPAFMFSAE